MAVHRAFVVVAGLAGLAGLVGAHTARADGPKPAAPSGTGVISGTVIFEGEAPARTPIQRKSDPVCAKTERLSEDVIVNHGKLRDAIVRITDGVTGTFATPTAPALIDQRDCMYSPRVLGVMAGQPLAIRNSDNTFHNVHGTLGGKTIWNKPHAPQDPDVKPDHVPAAGEVIELHCDVHPWMHAWAVVATNPYFAITGDDGKFELTGLPAGTYTIESWHPVLGKRSLTVKVGVGPKGSVKATLSYKARDLPAPDDK